MGTQIPNKHNPFRTEAVDEVAVSASAEAANARTLTIQAKARGKNVAAAVPLTVYLSDVATGIGINAAAPSGGIAIGAAGAILAAVVAGKYLECVTSAAGVLNLVVTEATAKTFYVVVKLPDGSMSTPFALAFA